MSKKPERMETDEARHAQIRVDSGRMILTGEPLRAGGTASEAPGLQRPDKARGFAILYALAR